MPPPPFQGPPLDAVDGRIVGQDEWNDARMSDWVNLLVFLEGLEPEVAAGHVLGEGQVRRGFLNEVCWNDENVHQQLTRSRPRTEDSSPGLPDLVAVVLCLRRRTVLMVTLSRVVKFIVSFVSSALNVVLVRKTRTERETQGIPPPTARHRGKGVSSLTWSFESPLAAWRPSLSFQRNMIDSNQLRNDRSASSGFSSFANSR